MTDTITVINTLPKNFPITQGVRTSDLMSRLNKLDSDEKVNLINETTQILSNCINPINTVDNTTGIAIGYVQSGKTLSFTTLTTLAIDNGFRIVVYFAGIKVNLLEQTTKRLKKDLLTEGENSRFYKVYQSPTMAENYHIKIQSALKLNHRPTILITVLKHYKHIDELNKIFKTPQVKDELGNNGVLIIDDEADQASLNTYARKNSKSENWEDDEFSSTYSSILNFRASIPNHSYVQYTATPQGPLLINLMDLLSPKFHVVLTPGKSYTGGKVFFEEKPELIIKIPTKEVYHHKYNQLEECPQSLIDALQLFLIAVAINVNIEEKESFLSMMIHADREQDASKKFYEWTKMITQNWSGRLGLPSTDPNKIELIEEFRINYFEAIKSISNPPPFAIVLEEVLQVILDTNLELVIQGSKEINWNNASAHILIGADMLNRGYTIEGLCVSYMPRYSLAKSNADTIQQRCRFFGYKLNYLNSCRVFLPNDSILEYRDYVIHEEIMRVKLKENSLKEIEQILVLSPEMNPTRNNILNQDVVSQKLSGWRQLNALQHIESNISFVENFISVNNFKIHEDFGTPARNHRVLNTTINTVIEFLQEFKLMNMPDTLRKSSTIQYLKYLSMNNKLNHAYIFQMGYDYDIEDKKGTEIIRKNDTIKLSNIFAGRSNSGSIKYPGDREMKFEDSICIQIHHIKIKDQSLSLQWGSKNLYTLGIYYPPQFAHSFTGVITP